MKKICFSMLMGGVMALMLATSSVSAQTQQADSLKRQAEILTTEAVQKFKEGKFSEAEPLFMEALTLRRRLYMRDHAELAGSINNMAVFYSNQGRFAETESLYKEALAMNRHIFNRDHPDLATNINNIAVFYDDQQQFSVWKNHLYKCFNYLIII
jgi:tetratricopeptide (TPR) repeat protein